ncbi:DUF1513 domain-containing protein [Chitinibacter sp. GC72]|uniref:DUF1513 domain-containing protein n=1 Tax=Chitinibacter sp. GC72 TaxID=1526917 RepID=UPI0012FAB16A|nr:DUF1513 domain-containing protein [Chitinibacter sp. GC72]
MNRRHFLQLSVLALPLAGFAHASKADLAVSPRLLSAYWGDDGQGLVLPQQRASIALPGRGHAIVPLPDGEALVVSRRLGSWLAKISWWDQQLLQLVDAAPDRHFFGHALRGADGDTLLLTENDDDSGAGLVGVYDAQSLRKLSEIPSYGIGPHELLWLSPGKILAVANGGILTLPESGRTKLNRSSMAPNLSLIEWPSGQLLAQYSLADKALSLRHLALAADGTLGIAIQAEYLSAAQHRDAPLLAILRPGADALQLAGQKTSLMGYAASIAAHGNEFLISAMRGNQLARWRSDGSALESLPVPRPAGIVSDGASVWLSSEAGSLYRYSQQDQSIAELAGYTHRKWDNHLSLAI